MKPVTEKKPLVVLPSRDSLAFAAALAEGPVRFTFHFGEVTSAVLAPMPVDVSEDCEAPMSGVPMSGVRMRSGEAFEAMPASVRRAA